MKHKNGAFTLIELLIVMAILAVLATVAVLEFGNAKAKTRDGKRKADLKQIQTAVDMYYTSNISYPGWGNVEYYSVWDNPGTHTGENCWCRQRVNEPTNLAADLGFKNALIGGGFIAALPIDPVNMEKGGNFLASGPLQALGYYYKTDGNNGYVLGANLEALPAEDNYAGNYRLSK